MTGDGGKVVVGFRPGAPRAGRGRGARGTIQGTADVVEYLGNEELLHVTSGGKDIVAIVDSSHRVKPGRRRHSSSCPPTSSTCSTPRRGLTIDRSLARGRGGPGRRVPAA